MLSLAKEQYKTVTRVAILVFSGIDELDFVIPHRVFNGVVKMNGTLTKCDLVAAEGVTQVTSGHGLTAKVDVVLSAASAPNYDLVVVPGGRNAYQPTAFAQPPILADPNLVDLLKKVAAANPSILFASICTGAFLLASADILGPGSSVSTHHRARQNLAELGVNVVTDRVALTAGSDNNKSSNSKKNDSGYGNNTDSGDSRNSDTTARVVLTAGGITSALDLSFAILELILGPEQADLSAATLEYFGRFVLKEQT
ncbi:hypothetical protein HK100_012742 [Physocladia obscura]|uniref:DJ-1/PfpI domain-containing protein n=1 Tax=Physocladia obscura TaxID=109957 RepID=A0AAD5XCZ4_9FUNG|nr:hypothetical protein HK100_012742 [Physocladia obscura]